MKQQISSYQEPANSKNRKRILFGFLLSMAIGGMILLPSFSNPELSSSSSMLPFSKPTSFEPTAINCKINNVIAKGIKTNEASFFIMEQTEGVFAKVLNMSLEDENGNLLAVSLTDLENAKMDSCLTTNYYFGDEHEKSNENFSNDIGSTIFSNSSNLIFEKKDGTSLISRNGWVKINRCEYGQISGEFYFEMEGEKTFEAEFVNILLEKDN